jgi:hypothetical protein
VGLYHLDVFSPLRGRVDGRPPEAAGLAERLLGEAIAVRVWRLAG